MGKKSSLDLLILRKVRNSPMTGCVPFFRRYFVDSVRSRV